ncbi:MAG: hypothetical protein MRECE_12c036 [Mycoplasmataceae bacterium CE_OT135]|nr:MAG: hypothetical protein MRECE_12c036 [Mycoplasmataceae bacterium CE_OT135]
MKTTTINNAEQAKNRKWTDPLQECYSCGKYTSQRLGRIFKPARCFCGQKAKGATTN